MYLQTALEEILSPEDVKLIGKELFVLVDDKLPNHMYHVGNWKDRMTVIALAESPNNMNRIPRCEWLFDVTNDSLCKYICPKYNNDQGRQIVVVKLANGDERWVSTHHLRRTYTYRVCDVSP